MKLVASFAHFWWNFIVGDDWTVAAGLAAGLGLTAALAHNDVTAWWLMPLAVVALLSLSLWRARAR